MTTIATLGYTVVDARMAYIRAALEHAVRPGSLRGGSYNPARGLTPFVAKGGPGNPWFAAVEEDGITDLARQYLRDVANDAGTRFAMSILNRVGNLPAGSAVSR